VSTTFISMSRCAGVTASAVRPTAERADIQLVRGDDLVERDVLMTALARLVASSA
jgi:hypothetical protein